MTEKPVAAANARTMWKRETPATPAISSSVNSLAKWLSIYQSAFWAGFIAPQGTPRSGSIMRSWRAPHLIVLALLARWPAKLFAALLRRVFGSCILRRRRVGLLAIVGRLR